MKGKLVVALLFLVILILFALAGIVGEGLVDPNKQIINPDHPFGEGLDASFDHNATPTEEQIAPTGGACNVVAGGKWVTVPHGGSVKDPNWSCPMVCNNRVAKIQCP